MAGVGVEGRWEGVGGEGARRAVVSKTAGPHKRAQAAWANAAAARAAVSCLAHGRAKGPPAPPAPLSLRQKPLGSRRTCPLPESAGAAVQCGHLAVIGSAPPRPEPTAAPPTQGGWGARSRLWVWGPQGDPSPGGRVAAPRARKARHGAPQSPREPERGLADPRRGVWAGGPQPAKPRLGPSHGHGRPWPPARVAMLPAAGPPPLFLARGNGGPAARCPWRAPRCGSGGKAAPPATSAPGGYPFPNFQLKLWPSTPRIHEQLTRLAGHLGGHD